MINNNLQAETPPGKGFKNNAAYISFWAGVAELVMLFIGLGAVAASPFLINAGYGALAMALKVVGGLMGLPYLINAFFMPIGAIFGFISLSGKHKKMAWTGAILCSLLTMFHIVIILMTFA